MRRFAQYFMEGILILAPVALTIYVVGRVLGLLEGLGRNLLFGVGLAEVPGLGVVLAILVIALIGWVGGHWLARRAIRLGESILARIPMVKSVYGSVKDVVDAFGGKKQSFSKVCLVRVPGFPIELLGFVTNEDLVLLGEPGRDKVSVYVPQSLQLGGFVAVVPRENVTVLDTPPQAALKFLMTAGMTDGAPEAEPAPRGRRG